jgi:hypothetical protein
VFLGVVVIVVVEVEVDYEFCFVGCRDTRVFVKLVVQKLESCWLFHF